MTPGGRLYESTDRLGWPDLEESGYAGRTTFGPSSSCNRKVTLAMPWNRFIFRLAFLIGFSTCSLLMLSAANLALAEEHFLANGVTAHRGNSGEQPENTLAAFRSGIEVGADWIELDIYRTADGKIVVIHDVTTGRVAGENLPVEKSNWETLRKLDVATEFRQQRGLSREDCPPHSIPLLRDVLKLVMSQDRTRVSIQPKSDCVAEAIAIVQELNAQKWVGFNDGSLAKMAQVKRLAPEIPVFWDRPAQANVEADIRTAQQHGFKSLVWNRQGVTAEKIKQIQAAGLEVGAWTVNDPEEMQRFLQMGIDRIYTDHPRELLKRIHNQ